MLMYYLQLHTLLTCVNYVNYAGYQSRHVNSGGRRRHAPPKCLENATAVGESLTSLGIDWLDRQLSRQTRNVGPVNLSWKAKHYTCNFVT